VEQKWSKSGDRSSMRRFRKICRQGNMKVLKKKNIEHLFLYFGYLLQSLELFGKIWRLENKH